MNAYKTISLKLLLSFRLKSPREFLHLEEVTDIFNTQDPSACLSGIAEGSGGDGKHREKNQEGGREAEKQ